MRKIAALLTLVAVAGCAPHWVKPGATGAELMSTSSMCATQAYSHFPPSFQQQSAGPGYYTAPQLVCSGYGPFQSCSQVGGQYVPPPIATVDANAPGRAQATDECMIGNGWQLRY